MITGNVEKHIENALLSRSFKVACLKSSPNSFKKTNLLLAQDMAVNLN